MDSSSSLVQLSVALISFAIVAILFLFILWKLLLSWWILPHLSHRKLKANGFSGPKPSFPLGNLNDMKKLKAMTINSIPPSPSSSSSSSSIPSNDIHSTVFPYFARWQKLHGKVFIYWLGTEPFLYIADPEFLKKMSSDIKGKSWGKPTVFKNDREPMFGNGLVMVEGEDWVRHRHVITPAFSPSNLKAMSSLMVDSATKMLERWALLTNSGSQPPEIDAQREIIGTAGEIIAKTSFGISYENGRKVFEKLRDLQMALFNTNRYVGVPYGRFLNPKKNMKSKALGEEINDLLRSIILDRCSKPKAATAAEKDLLGLLLADNLNTTADQNKKALTTKELVDECKTFFFGGYETTALALTWTLLLLAVHPEWQNQLREEIKDVMMGDGSSSSSEVIIDATMVAGLKKMGWVMNEVLRLYPPAPNVQRQARQDIRVGDIVIPNGTNMWIDVVSMHHDESLWGNDVNEFKPERFKDDVLYGGCKHKMGYLPFGFGGRMCVGRNLTNMEYKIVLTLILTRFSFSLSPNYSHAPCIMLSLRPMHGLPLIFKPL